MQRTPCSQSGFSLIEVIIAMAILAIGITGVMRFFRTGLQQAQIAQERSVAAELADDRLGRVRMAGARGLLQNRGTILSSGVFNNIATAGNAYTFYDGVLTSVHPMAGAVDTFLQRVTFAVEMFDGRREMFVTYVTDY